MASTLYCRKASIIIIIIVERLTQNDLVQYLRGAILNRTYGTHKNLYMFSIFTRNIRSYLLPGMVPRKIVDLYGLAHAAGCERCHHSMIYQQKHVFLVWICPSILQIYPTQDIITAS